jgi:hypothetical protein
MNPDEASLFVVGFSVYLAEGLGRCREFKSVAKMEQVVVISPPSRSQLSLSPSNHLSILLRVTPSLTM